MLEIFTIISHSSHRRPQQQKNLLPLETFVIIYHSSHRGPQQQNPFLPLKIFIIICHSSEGEPHQQKHLLQLEEFTIIYHSSHKGSQQQKPLLPLEIFAIIYHSCHKRPQQQKHLLPLDIFISSTRQGLISKRNSHFAGNIYHYPSFQARDGLINSNLFYSWTCSSLQLQRVLATNYPSLALFIIIQQFNIKGPHQQ